MNENEGMKEVYFDQSCKTCRHEKVDEAEDPCAACLDEPMNQNSHKPVKWEER